MRMWGLLRHDCLYGSCEPIAWHCLCIARTLFANVFGVAETMDRKLIVEVSSLTGAYGDDCVVLVASSLPLVAAKYGDAHAAIEKQLSIGKSLYST